MVAARLPSLRPRASQRIPPTAALQRLDAAPTSTLWHVRVSTDLRITDGGNGHAVTHVMTRRHAVTVSEVMRCPAGNAVTRDTGHGTRDSVTKRQDGNARGTDMWSGAGASRPSAVTRLIVRGGALGLREARARIDLVLEKRRFRAVRAQH